MSIDDNIGEENENNMAPILGSKRKEYLDDAADMSVCYTVLTAAIQFLIYFLFPHSRIGTIIFNVVGAWWTILAFYWTFVYLCLAYAFITRGIKGLGF